MPTFFEWLMASARGLPQSCLGWKKQPPQDLTPPDETGLRETNAELRRLAEDMRVGRERAFAGFRGSPIALHTTTPEGIMIDVSDRWLKLMGWTRDEAPEHILGRHWSSFHTSPQPNQPMEDYHVLRSGGEVQDRPRQLIRRDGSLVPVEVSKRLEVGRDGTEYIVCVVVDVSARKDAEQALRLAEQRLAQANKMEAIGQITGGVAHDFNNLLQAITGNLKLILARTKNNDPLDVAQVHKKINNALLASEQAARLTAQLLAFARRSNLNPQPFDPAKTLEDMRALIETTAGSKVTLSWYAEPGAGMCLADQSQLSNAVLNLVANARDAIAPHGRGTICLSITKHVVLAGDPQADEAPPGDYIRIAVRDDGVGMTPEVRARAFEPFFTTKDIGRGTGLGLSSVHGFAGQSNGMVTIDSKPGHGAEVAILLPWHQGRPVVEVELAPKEDYMPPGRGECILVVEDVEPVREVLCDTLTEIGYRVIEAESADKALCALQTAGIKIDAVLTDMAMPGSIDGLELCGVVRVKWRNIPIALMTGNMDPPRGARLPAGTRFLAKPYPPHLVAIMLREMLEESETAT